MPIFFNFFFTKFLFAKVFIFFVHSFNLLYKIWVIHLLVCFVVSFASKGKRESDGENKRECFHISKYTKLFSKAVGFFVFFNFFVFFPCLVFYCSVFYFLRIKHIHEQHEAGCPHGTNTIYERLQHNDSFLNPYKSF